MNDKLLAVSPDGIVTYVPNSYEGIKAGLGGATLDFVVIDESIGYFIDDNGMFTQALNVPASFLACRPIYGPVVMAAAEPDDEGETLPAAPAFMKLLAVYAQAWASVVMHATELGQELVIRADPSTLPPPRLYVLDQDTWKEV